MEYTIHQFRRFACRISPVLPSPGSINVKTCIISLSRRTPEHNDRTKLRVDEMEQLVRELNFGC